MITTLNNLPWQICINYPLQLPLEHWWWLRTWTMVVLLLLNSCSSHSIIIPLPAGWRCPTDKQQLCFKILASTTASSPSRKPPSFLQFLQTSAIGWWSSLKLTALSFLRPTTFNLIPFKSCIDYYIWLGGRYFEETKMMAGDMLFVSISSSFITFFDD